MKIKKFNTTSLWPIMLKSAMCVVLIIASRVVFAQQYDPRLQPPLNFSSAHNPPSADYIPIYWTNGQTGGYIELFQNGNCSGLPFAEVSGHVIGYQHRGIIRGRGYTYSARRSAIGPYRAGDCSNSAIGSLGVHAPSVLDPSTSRTDGVHLRWYAPAEGAITSFRVYRDVNPCGQGGQHIAEVPASQREYLDTGATPGISHQYIISTVDETGHRGDCGWAPTRGTRRLERPGNVRATSDLTGRIRVSWEAPAGMVQRYDITDHCPGSTYVYSEYSGGAPATQLHWDHESGVTPGRLYRYFVRATGQGGHGTSECADAFGRALPPSPPIIITQPAQSVARFEGQRAQFSVVAIGPNLSYRWQFSPDGGQNFYDIQDDPEGAWFGAATAHYDTHTPPGTSGTQFRVRISNSDGVVTSTIGTLVVHGPPLITDQPDSVSVVEGTRARFSVSATGLELRYQWQFSPDGGENFYDIHDDPHGAWSGVSTATYETHTPVATSGMLFRVQVSNPAGTVMSSSALMTIQRAPTPTATRTATATASATRTATATASTTHTATATRTATPTLSATSTASPTVTVPSFTATPVQSDPPAPSFPTLTATPTQEINLSALSPLLDCVEHTSRGTLIAHFGYSNMADKEIIVSSGSDNYLDPTLPGITPTEKFLMGRVRNAFAVEFSQASVAWVLGARVALATANSPACCTDESGVCGACDGASCYGCIEVTSGEVIRRATVLNRTIKKLLSKFESRLGKRARVLHKLVKKTKKVLVQLPPEAQICTDQVACRQLDHGSQIDQLSENFKILASSLRRLKERSVQVHTNDIKKIEKSIRELPRFTSMCG